MVKQSLLLFCLILASNTYAADALRYTLMPGSTITPYAGEFAIGPAEPLTGYFDWNQAGTGGDNIVGYDSTFLDFQSASYRIELNTTSNTQISAIFPTFCKTTFSEIVNLTGLGASVGEMDSYTDGCYFGPPDHPYLLNYQDVKIYPQGGGYFVARLKIVAALDSDRNGIPDNIDQLLPCSGPASGGVWKNHGEYVSSTVETAHSLFISDLITKDQFSAIVSAAAQSSCGKK